jgi:hypothetical protein
MTASFQHHSQHHEPVTSVRDHVTWRKSSHSGSQGNCIEAIPLAGVQWHKSSHSGDTGNCIEAAALDGAAWRTSSRSGTQGNCVEVSGRLPGAVAVRDSTDPDGAKLLFPAAAWRDFARTLKA